MVPSQSPAQVTSVCVAFGSIGNGAVMVNEMVVSHPTASVMVRLYACGQSPVAFALPCPAPGAGLHA